MAAHVEIDLRDTGHVGKDIIDYVHRLLMIDEEWTEWHDDGFTWWSHMLAQRFRWEGPNSIDGTPTWFVSVETDFVAPEDPSDPRLRDFINQFNQDLGVGAAEIDGDRVRVRARTYAMRETAQDRGKLLADAAIMTNSTLHAWLQGAESFEGDWPADTSDHPTQGAREIPDEMLSIVERVHLVQGENPAEPSWNLDMDYVTPWLMARGIAAHGGDFQGVVHARWTAGGTPFLWSVVRAWQHPVFGYGMKSSLAGPVDAMAAALGKTGASGASLAASLNMREHTGSIPLRSCGAWVTDDHAPEPLLVHQQFIPNVGFSNGLALGYAIDAIYRTHLISGQVLRGSP